MAVLLSAFFSGTETAFISASQVKVEVWVRQKIWGAAITLKFLENPEKFLITTLIGNNIAMVAASTLMAFYLEPYFQGISITAISALLLLTFGEILPKSFSSEQATAVSIRVSHLLRIMYFLLYPFIVTTRVMTHWMMDRLGFDKEQTRQVFSRKDMDRLVREGSRSGVMKQDEQDLISRFILRGDFRLRDVMVHRTEIVAIQLQDSIQTVRQVFEKTGYSRLPVMDDSIDDIVGFVTALDLIFKRPGNVKQILRKIRFVPGSRKIASFFSEIQDQPIDIAVVVDEYGGTAGLVTLEDIVEEFFGDIQDEYDEDLDLYRTITEKQIDVNARIEIHEINAQHHLMIPEGEYNTLGGFIMKELGHIPRRSEKIELPHCTLTVLSATRRMVKWVRIHKTGTES
ncbi:HlyC/CorC family transporter [bacterium]|nr:HlyC/CorC family transporter [bacterium]